MNWRKEREELKAGIDRVPVIEKRFEKLEQTIGGILSTLEQLVNRDEVSSSLGEQKKAKAIELSTSTPATETTMGVLEHREEQRPNRKLDFPFFSGEDLDGWVFKVERYF